MRWGQEVYMTFLASLLRPDSRADLLTTLLCGLITLRGEKTLPSQFISSFLAHNYGVLTYPEDSFLTIKSVEEIVCKRVEQINIALMIAPKIFLFNEQSYKRKLMSFCCRVLDLKTQTGSD